MAGQGANAPAAGTLYVVFSGTMMLMVMPSDDPKEGIKRGGIRALIPDADSLVPGVRYSYKVGTWHPRFDAKELEHAQRYSLEGVEDGPGDRFDPDVNIVVTGPLAPNYESFLRCSLVFPPPEKTYSVNRIPVPSDSFVDPHAATVKDKKKLALQKVLTYRVADFSRLRVVESNTGHTLWAPQDALAADTKLTLHVFAEQLHFQLPAHHPEKVMAAGAATSATGGPSEPPNPFAALLKLTKDQSYGLKVGRKGTEPIEQGDIPPGLNPIELQPLPSFWAVLNNIENDGLRKPFNCYGITWF